jgi:hypothetical protein
MVAIHPALFKKRNNSKSQSLSQELSKRGKLPYHNFEGIMIEEIFPLKSIIRTHFLS